MKKISGSTFLLKRIVAVSLLIFWGSWLIAPFLSSDDEFPPLLALVLFVVGSFIWFSIYRQTLGDLADTVYDNGDELIFIKGKNQQRVNIQDITNISFQHIILLQRITVHTRTEGVIGKELVFKPPVRLAGFSQNPILSDLIERVERARKEIIKEKPAEYKSVEMKKISRSAFYEKKVLPTFFFGFFALSLVICFLGTFFGGSGEGFLNSLLTFLAIAAGIAVFAGIVYLAGIRSAWALADEVFDYGNKLVFRKGRKEQHVYFNDIININCSHNRITIYSRSEGPIGKELAFKPLTRLNIFKKNPLFLDLIERVDRARQT